MRGIRTARRAGLALAVVAGLAGAATAAPASAATVSVVDGTLVYAAAPGEENEVDVLTDTTIPDAIDVYEYFSQITTGNGCLPYPVIDPLGPYVGVFAVCRGVTKGIDIDLGDGDDYAGGEAGLPAKIVGGPGNDHLYGTDTDDVLDGGPGNDRLVGWIGKDTLTGGPGNDDLDGGYVTEDFGGEIPIDGEPVAKEAEADGSDVLDGGPGDDRLRGGRGTDRISGGEGDDTADYAFKDKAVTVTLDGVANDGTAGENDALAGDIESVETGSGPDRVVGTSGKNTISTGDGDDVVEPRGGVDHLDLGAGADKADLRDGAIDNTACGEGSDAIETDANDVVDNSCETVARAATKPAGLILKLKKSGAGARLTVKASGKLRLPKGTDPRECVGSGVRVTLRSGGHTATGTALMAAGCAYSVTLHLTRAGPVTGQASFVGSPRLAGLKSKKVRLR